MQFISYSKRFVLSIMVVLTFFLGNLPEAKAALFDTNITTPGSQISLDTGYTEGAVSGAFGKKQGGALSGSTYTSAGVTGSNPIGGAFTDIGDGFRLSENTSINTVDDFL